MNIILKNITIEVTRRCNLNCKHCMRGDCQNIDIDYRYIDLLLKCNHYIYKLFFSGGEPLLNTQAIIYAINKIIEENLFVFSIGFNTNATIYDEKLISNLLKYQEYCLKKFPELYQSNDISNSVGIIFSNDQFHNYDPKIIEKYKYLSDKINFQKTGTLDELEDEIILSGKAKGNFYFGKYFNFENKTIEIEKLDSNSYLFSNYFYITSKGDITTQGDGSYIDMDHYNLGNLEEDSFYSFIAKNLSTNNKIKILKK